MPNVLLTHFWIPSRKANVVQIGRHITIREPGETLNELIDRAIREYPETRAIALLGWREQNDADLRDNRPALSRANVPVMSRVTNKNGLAFG
jgi:hypothetical protein